ncbi:Las1-like-domain-containing protein [Scleroderma yunnanense]
MRLPRRIPWAHIGELDQVCSWIFTDEEDIEAKILAVNRLSAWKAITALPHALESTLAILVARLQDVPSQMQQHSYTSLNLRQTYASAIIRMVNGLVDPLQVGAFARSIVSIAAQLGLPSWLVELRHAATHEDLPSLELLREAAQESLAWLFHNYFQPTLIPSAALPPPSVPLRPVTPLLKSYKVIMKTVTRDASLRKRQQGDIDAIIRDIERWIAEVRVSADLTNDVLAWGVDEHAEDDGGDTRDRGALEALCDTLLDTSALIPLAKKKRRAPPEPYLPTTTSIALWTPLLNQLRDHHPIFPSVFVSRAVSTLLRGPTQSGISTMDIEDEDSARDATYDEYLARWVVWAIQTWEDSSGSENHLRKELLLSLSPSLVPGKSTPVDKSKILTTLIKTTTLGYKELETAAELLLAVTLANPVETWKTDDLAQMNRRLEMLSSYDIAMKESERLAPPSTAPVDSPVAQTIGWTLLDAQSGWKPCPIGVYYHRQGVCEDVPM